MSSKKKVFNLRYFHLCDFASVTSDDKTNLLGIFEKIIVKQLPASIAHLYIVFNIESETNNEKPFDLSLKAASGKELFAQKIEGRIEIPKGKKKVIINCIVQLNNLPIEETGDYSLTLSCGDELIRQEKLTVEQLP